MIRVIRIWLMVRIRQNCYPKAMQCDEEISTIIIRPGCSGRDAEDHDSNDKDDNALLSE
jgi:hypothetical protein